MQRILKYIISENTTPVTILDFLKKEGFSRHILSSMKNTPNTIILNSERGFGRSVLKPQDHLIITVPETESGENIIRTKMDLNIIYEDEDILVINKPADMPVHPSAGNYENTLANGIAWYFAEKGEDFVYRCINRLDYGKKYCHHSPSIEESLLQDAVMRAIMQTAKQNVEVLKTLKIHIGMGLTDEVTEDKTLDIQIRIAEINTEFQKLLKAVSADNADGIDEERITELMNEKQRLTVQLEQYAAMRQKRESAKSRLDEIYTILDGLQNHPMEYNDKLVRQIIECIVVESKEKIKVVFIGGTEIEMTL